MRRLTITTITVIFLTFTSGCFVPNHIKLVKKSHDASERYDDLTKKESAASDASERRALEYAKSYLKEAKSANRRWDNVRARLFVELANEQMEYIENPPTAPAAKPLTVSPRE